MIKNIVFDVGLVLVEFNWQTYLDSFHFEKEKRDIFVGLYSYLKDISLFRSHYIGWDLLFIFL